MNPMLEGVFIGLLLLALAAVGGICLARIVVARGTKREKSTPTPPSGDSELDDLRRSVEERSTARPVVRATLACRYCMTTFTQDFTAEDDLRTHTSVCSIPLPLANVKRERQSSVRCWLFWSTLKTGEVREPIACPNCGRKCCAITRREPIAKEPATMRIAWTTPQLLRRFDSAGDAYTTPPVSFSDGEFRTRGI